MKRFYILLFDLLFVSLSISSQGFNSLAQEGLKGDVKSIKTICYNASEYNGSICNNGIITYDYETGLYPISKYEYNTEGNLIKLTIYDENERREEESEYKYIENVNIEWWRSIDAVPRGGKEGDLLTARGWYIEFDAGKPISQTFYFKDGYASMVEEYGDLRNQKFEGVKVKSYDRYVYGELEERVEKSWNYNLLIKYVSKDKDGNISYMQTNVWSDSGQILCTYVETEGDVIFDSFEYNEDGFLVKYSSRINSEVNKEDTFKYLSHDSNGNWTKRIIYTQGKAYIEERTIIYYKIKLLNF